jgi:uncharacterized membrane protein
MYAYILSELSQQYISMLSCVVLASILATRVYYKMGKTKEMEEKQEVLRKTNRLLSLI